VTADLLVRGGRDSAGDPVEIAVRDGVVAASSDSDLPVLDAAGMTVLPGLLDLQVNGAAGVDLTLKPERLWEVAAALPAYGVTACLPTVITAPPEIRARALAALRAGPPDDRVTARPLGLHFEGPFLSPARPGAHPTHLLVEPDPALVAGWTADAGVAMVTLAPELPGALDLVAALTARGVVVSVGHTDATGDAVRRAVAAGARCFTHLFNAMPGPISREPGPAGVALDDPALVAGLIVDGHHLAPEMVRLAWHRLGPDRFLSVSDTTAALGLPDGPTRLGEQQVMLLEGAVRLADGTLAGSAASLAHCLGELVRTTGCTRAEAVATATTTPAALMGDTTGGHLRPGARGDLVLVRPGTFDVVATVVGGRIAIDRR